MIQKSYHLLVVDDDQRLRQLLQHYLQENGFVVTTAQNTQEARSCLQKDPIDAIILDVMMPGENGNDFTHTLRKDLTNPKARIPILMLTALGEPDNRIQGLEAGADDYLAKPFEPRELLLRIQRLMERHSMPAITQPSGLRFGPKTFDTTAFVLTEGPNRIHLTSMEIELLKVFANHPGIPLSREDLAQRFGLHLSPRTVDVQITRLRKKIEPDPSKPIYLRTVRHKGYALWPDQ